MSSRPHYSAPEYPNRSPQPIDSDASIVGMRTTLTIRNLDEDVKRKLRLRAAGNQRSMEAEARDILAASLAGEPFVEPNPAEEKARRRQRIEAVIGIWKERYEGKSTDEIMRELRGDD